MMKKVVNILLVALLSFGIACGDVYANKTLGDLKTELKQFKSEYAAANSDKKKTESEINAQKNNISNAYSEIEKAESDIEIAKNNIEKSQQDIVKAKIEIEELLVFYEISQGENDFLQYITGSSSMTDMMMRIEAVSHQL